MADNSFTYIAGVGAAFSTYGQSIVFQYPSITGTSYSFFGSPVNGTIGPNLILGDFLDFSGTSQIFNDIVAPGSLSTSQGAAQGLFGIQINNYNGLVAEDFFSQQLESDGALTLGP